MNKALILTVSALAFIATPAFASSVEVVSGGVGESSREMIKQAQGQYSLKLVLTGNGGMYLSDVAVSITDRKGDTVASENTEGPIVLAALKPGTYTVSATYGDKTAKRTVAIGKGLKTVQIALPVTDEPSHLSGTGTADSSLNVPAPVSGSNPYARDKTTVTTVAPAAPSGNQTIYAGPGVLSAPNARPMPMPAPVPSTATPTRSTDTDVVLPALSTPVPAPTAAQAPVGDNTEGNKENRSNNSVPAAPGSFDVF